MTLLDPRPWTALPPDAAAALRPELPAIAEEIIGSISAGVPEYALPLEGRFGEGLRMGVERALQRFLDLSAKDDGGPDPGRQVYVDLGRGELRAGRPLEALLAAYRLGARVAWRRLAAAGEQAGLEPRTLYLLAESIFAYIDELSGESVEGYAMEQAVVAGAHQRRRRELAALLVQDPPADATAVEAAAVAAGWPLPRVVAALYLEPGAGEAATDPDRIATRLGGEAIATELAPGACALVPDPDAPGRRGQLVAAVGDGLAALGPSMPWREAHVSATRARAALALARSGALAASADATSADAAPSPGDPGSSPGLVIAADHPVALLLAADRRLARDIAANALAPLAGETAASRERLTETLAAWLRHRGRTEAVAAALHVHPQTVRYRVGRLRELYGDRLDDPDARFELELALRSPPAVAS
ncbi:MAG TPA: helix-turn-helix domain-containing protein [Thermoleophilaceae bacterium]|nr:helix-turn-helix domain-containing protein [Thermoleophilaceae bacterium]